MMYKTVFFDLDGTLLDTLEDLADSANDMLIKRGYPERSVEEIRQFVGNGMKNLVERCLPYKVDDSEFQICYELFRKLYSENMQNKTKPYDGVVSCLEKLKAEGIKSVVVSNKNDDAVKKLCSDYFGNLISEAYGRKDGIPAKPDPTMVDIAVKEMGIDKSDCIFVGDSDTDIFTAHNAGLKAIGVLWGFREKEVLISSGADYIIRKIEDIFSTILL